MLKIFAPVLLAGCVLGATSASHAGPPQGYDPASGCPAMDGRMGQVSAKVDAKMKAIVSALQENKKSADTLIAAAREAGAQPQVIADMEKMSAAFRQFFMSSVQPQQIVESILSAPVKPEGSAGLIITAPDGSAWLVSPQMVPPAPQQPPRMGHDSRHDGAGMRGVQMPPADVLQNPALRKSPPAPAAQGHGVIPGASSGQPGQELIIMEETVEDMPYWPTKQQLGKDGVLKYLEKRAQGQGG